jgi:tRNA(Ile)-lysidine synthase
VKLPPHRFQLARRLQRELADIPSGQLVHIACSGGPDSMALAIAAADARLNAEAVIIDHQLQPNSAQVAENAAEQCQQIGLPARIEVVQVVDDGVGPEAAARLARYNALDAIVAETAAAAVLLGHTADDQAETVLLGLLRGSGVRSLAGMPARRGRYRRPFLDVARHEIEQALTESDVAPWRDPHNADPQFTRVRVRNIVLPMLTEQLGPGVTAGLRRTALLARADADALEDWAAREFARVAAAGMTVAELAELTEAIRWRVLRQWLLTVGCPAQDLTLDHVRSVDELITQWHGQGPLHLPGGVNVGRSYGTLVADGSIPDGGSE